MYSAYASLLFVVSSLGVGYFYFVQVSCVKAVENMIDTAHLIQ